MSELNREITLQFWRAVQSFTGGDPQPMVHFVAKYPLADRQWREIVSLMLSGQYRADRRRKTPTSQLADAFAREAATRIDGRPTNDEICERIAPDRDPASTLRSLKRYWARG